MARWVYMLVAFTVLAAWAGAQNPTQPALTAEDKIRLFKSNSAIIDNLVREGVAMSATDKPEERVEKCRGASVSLAREIEKAAQAEDAERFAELTSLFHKIVKDGLVPTLTESLAIVPPESPAGKKLVELRTNSNNDVSGLKSTIPATGKMADNPRVKAALNQLDELASVLPK